VQPDPQTQQAMARLETLEKESKAQKAAFETRLAEAEQALEAQRAAFETRLAEAEQQHQAQKAALEERLAEAEARVSKAPGARPGGTPDHGAIARAELHTLKQERDKERAEQRKLKHEVLELSVRLGELERAQAVPAVVPQPALWAVTPVSAVGPIAETAPAPAATATPSQATPGAGATSIAPPTTPEPHPSAPPAATGPPPATAQSPPSTAASAKPMGWRPQSEKPVQQKPSISAGGTLSRLFDPHRDRPRGKTK
jgi:hypothetical protein